MGLREVYAMLAPPRMRFAEHIAKMVEERIGALAADVGATVPDEDEATRPRQRKDDFFDRRR